MTIEKVKFRSSSGFNLLETEASTIKIIIQEILPDGKYMNINFEKGDILEIC